MKTGLRLRTKLSLLTTAAVLAVMLPLSFYAVESSRNLRLNEASRLMSGIAKMTAQGELTGITMGVNVPVKVLNEQLKNAVLLNNLLAFIVVRDADGKAKAGAVNPDVIDVLNSSNESETVSYLARDDIDLPSDLIVKTVLINEGEKSLGSVRAAFTVRPIESAAKKEAGRYIFITVVLICAGVGISLALSRMISRPAEELSSAMDKVRSGDLSAVVESRSRDELGHLAESFNYMVDGLKEGAWIKNTFSKYISRQVADKILSEKSEFDFGGEIKRVSVMFCDIRGFTTLSEKMSPRDIVSLLNEYFSDIIHIVFKYDGMLDKFVGDQIMAVFGAPIHQDDDELRAVRAAMEIQHAVHGTNARRAEAGLPVISMGIGINTGEAVAGNIGSEERTSYTVIGDNVNLAQRIESLSKEGQILVSEETYRAVEQFVDADCLGETKVKGKEVPINLYSVTAVNIA